MHGKTIESAVERHLAVLVEKTLHGGQLSTTETLKTILGDVEVLFRFDKGKFFLCAGHEGGFCYEKCGGTTPYSLQTMEEFLARTGSNVEIRHVESKVTRTLIFKKMRFRNTCAQLIAVNKAMILAEEREAARKKRFGIFSFRRKKKY